MPRRSFREGLTPTRLMSAISNISAEAHNLIETDRIRRLQRLAEAARTCGPPPTPSEAEFVGVVRRNGEFSLELVIACVFTMWYMCIVLIHLYSFDMDFMVAVRCQVPPLETHFYFDQILNISVKNHKSQRTLRNEYCSYDLRNYTDLVKRHKYNYIAIMEEINNETGNPKLIPCQKYVVKGPPYVLEAGHHGLRKHCIREEFKLFCTRRKWYVLIGDARTFAMIASAPAIGLFSDITGRKPTFVVTAVVQLLAFIIVLLPSKWYLVLGRFIFGFAEPSDVVIFTLFLEKCSKTTRMRMGTLILMVFPLAHGIAYFLCQIMHFWRAVVLANISMFLVLPFGIWYIVESPRWLMFTRRRADAWKALQTYGVDIEPNLTHLAETAPSKPTVKSVIRYFTLKVYRTRVKSCVVIFTLCGIVMDISVRLNRPIQHLYGWPYYICYVMLQTMVSSVGYVLCITVGAQKSLFIFLMTLGIVDVILLVERIKYEDNFLIFTLVLFHMTSGKVIYFLIVYYVNILFPTPCRVTAVCACLSLYWLGRVVEGRFIAPLTEDSPYLNHLSALIATISCALAVCFLPNTKTELLADKPYDTLYPRMQT